MSRSTAIHKGKSRGDPAACGKWIDSNMEFRTTWRGVTCGGCLAVQRAQKNPSRKVLKVHKSRGQTQYGLCDYYTEKLATDWRRVTCKRCRKLGGKAPLKS
jgi:hypothetical protein